MEQRQQQITDQFNRVSQAVQDVELQCNCTRERSATTEYVTNFQLAGVLAVAFRAMWRCVRSKRRLQPERP
eukprot:7216867-Lingulodinium_polyedra.AAC.1